jgi:hypothetical protein
MRARALLLLLLNKTGYSAAHKNITRGRKLDEQQQNLPYRFARARSSPIQSNKMEGRKLTTNKNNND